MAEAARSCISVLADLFERIDSYTDYPIDNLVFSNRHEQFCQWIQDEECLSEGKTEKLLQAYNCENIGNILEHIRICPNILHDHDDPTKNLRAAVDENLISESSNIFYDESLQNSM